MLGEVGEGAVGADDAGVVDDIGRGGRGDGMGADSDRTGERSWQETDPWRC